MSEMYNSFCNENKTIVIIFSGKCKHKWNPKFDYFSSFYNNIIKPLHSFNILIFVGCYKHEIQEWEEELNENIRKMNIENKHNIKVVYATNIPLETDLCLENNIFTLCKHRDKNKYKYQYGKLYYTFEFCKNYCTNNNIEIDYIIKSRFDLIYKEDNLFKLEWLSICSDEYICISSTEFHCSDRWPDRCPCAWPKMVCDQFIFGNLYTMTLHCSLYKSKMYESNYNKGIESIVASYLIFNKINVAAIEFQSSQPGGKYVLGKSNKWLETKSDYVKYLKY